MRSEDRKHFGEAWADCWAMYGKQVTPGVINMAFKTLQRYDLSDITAAMTRHMNDPDAGQFFPKPADIVRNIEGSKVSQGMLAWSKVEKAIRCVGRGMSLVFDDHLIHAVIDDMGGWPSLCRVDDKELPFKAREFEKRYQSYVLAPPSQFPKRLIGEFEADAVSMGAKIEPPVLVGDRQRAALVHQNGGESGGNAITRLSGSVNKAMAAITDNRGQRSA